MVIANADNLFGLSNFIVDPLADEGSYTTIQSAINAAVLAGGGKVFVKKATYLESLTLDAGIELIGVSADGRLGDVIVDGNHTFNGNGTCILSNMNFTTTGAGHTFDVAPAAGTGILAFKDCKVQSANLDAIHVDTTAIASIRLETSAVTGNLNGINIAATGGSASVIAVNSAINSIAGSGIIMADPSTVFLRTSTLGSAGIAIDMQTAGQIHLFDSQLSSGVFECIASPGGGSVTAQRSSFTSNTVLTFFITGTSNFAYADILLLGTAIDIDPAITASVYQWKPFATSTTPGTASFAVVDFAVNSAGQVSLNTHAGFAPAYTDINFLSSPYTVVPSDYFISCDTSGGAITLNFPNVPAAKRTWVVKDRTGNAGVNNITVTTPGGVVTFDGSATFTLNTNFSSIQLLANATPTYEVY